MNIAAFNEGHQRVKRESPFNYVLVATTQESTAQFEGSKWKKKYVSENNCITRGKCLPNGTEHDNSMNEAASVGEEDIVWNARKSWWRLLLICIMA